MSLLRHGLEACAVCVYKGLKVFFLENRIVCFSACARLNHTKYLLSECRRECVQLDWSQDKVYSGLAHGINRACSFSDAAKVD